MINVRYVESWNVLWNITLMILFKLFIITRGRRDYKWVFLHLWSLTVNFKQHCCKLWKISADSQIPNNFAIREKGWCSREKLWAAIYAIQQRVSSMFKTGGQIGSFTIFDVANEGQNLKMFSAPWLFRSTLEIVSIIHVGYWLTEKYRCREKISAF